MNPNEDKTFDTREFNRRLMNNIVRFPVIVDKAAGSRIRDAVTGQMLLDYWGDEGVCALGYNTLEFVQAMMRFRDSEHPHQLPDIYPNSARYAAAELICTRTGMDRIFFANSGAEANEGAIKLARKYWWDCEGPDTRLHQNVGRQHKILTIEGNFHGRTAFASAASDPRVSPYHRWGFGPLPEGFGVLEPCCSTDGGVEFRQVVTDGVEHAPRTPDWSEVAAIIMAPVLGNNCVRTYPKQFWNALKMVRARFGVLLIFDDVQAGSGRAGRYATWQDPSIGVKPDIMMLGKGLAMGFPASCILASERVAEAFTPGTHFNTFGGSPFVCFMAIEMFRWLDRNLPSVRGKGERIRNEFEARDWIKAHDGLGMLNAFTPDFERYGYNAYDFCHKSRALGLSLVTHREYGPIRFTPPLNVDDDEVARAIGILDETHKELAR